MEKLIKSVENKIKTGGKNYPPVIHVDETRGKYKNYVIYNFTIVNNNYNTMREDPGVIIVIKQGVNDFSGKVN